jgi:hypothetical protein
LGKRRTIEKVNGGDNSTNLENTNLDKRAIHIHKGMEQNLARYAKYQSYRRIEISGGSEFTGMEHNLGGMPNTTLVEAQKS